jgi:hypothetical protein
VIPPETDPEDGATLETVGANPLLYEYEFVSVPNCASSLVTVTLTSPASCGGVVAVIVVEFTTATLVAGTLPNATVTPVLKPVPTIVTDVPPASGPNAGEIDSGTGGCWHAGVVSVRSEPLLVFALIPTTRK